MYLMADNIIVLYALLSTVPVKNVSQICSKGVLNQRIIVFPLEKDTGTMREPDVNQTYWKAEEVIKIAYNSLKNTKLKIK
jgi:hypothetical protein